MALIKVYAFVNTYIVFANLMGARGKILEKQQYKQKELRLQLVAA